MAAIPNKWKGLNRLVPHLHEHRFRIVLGFISIVITNILLVAAPWVMKYAVDGLQELLTRERLVFYAWLIVMIAALEGIFRFAMRRLIIGVSRHIEYALRNQLFAHLETLSLS